MSLYSVTFTFSTSSLAVENTDTLTFTAGAGVIRDDNLFRTNDNRQSETIRQLTAGVNLDVPVSLQRFMVNAAIDDNRYQYFDNLNFQGGRGKANWAWKIGDRASGDIGYQYDRLIADFGDLQNRTRDLITRKTPFFGINYLVTPNWQAIGRVSRTELNHSDASRQSLNNDINTGAVGFNYISGPENSIGILAKRSNANYSEAQPGSILNISGLPIATVSSINNSYKEEEYSGVVNWGLTGVSRLIGRLGYTKRDQKEVPALSFSGGTGRLTYQWKLTGITSIDFSTYRELQSSDDLSATYIVTRGFSIMPAWSPTPTIKVKLRTLRETREYNGNAVFAASTQQRSDAHWNTQISTTYNPRSNTELSLSLERGKRNSNFDSFDYKYNLIMFKASLTI